MDDSDITPLGPAVGDDPPAWMGRRKQFLLVMAVGRDVEVETWRLLRRLAVYGEVLIQLVKGYMAYAD
jgi:hypothetical protein